MGKWFSKEESVRKVDSTGAINNNINLGGNDRINVYSEELVYIATGTFILKLIEILIFIYLKHKRNLKKTYQNRDSPA